MSVTDGEEQLRLSDVGKLARGVRRRVVGAARADDRPTFPQLLAAHLEVPLDDLEVVEESWPPYELVNVQTGLDAWLGPGTAPTGWSGWPTTSTGSSVWATCSEGPVRPRPGPGQRLVEQPRRADRTVR